MGNGGGFEGAKAERRAATRKFWLGVGALCYYVLNSVRQNSPAQIKSMWFLSVNPLNACAHHLSAVETREGAVYALRLPPAHECQRLLYARHCLRTDRCNTLDQLLRYSAVNTRMGRAIGMRLLSTHVVTLCGHRSSRTSCSPRLKKDRVTKSSTNLSSLCGGTVSYWTFC